ncbi:MULTISPECIES: hypothetical protein [unclassified Mesorhizobium]|uniref:hypothetical protein n=1 Tax=unclassified Mesorhizobium TaxID=325217 RepID=UPI000FD915B6|nr:MULTISPECIES: hypothetical protein [unclassified Mesorhizobium]TGR58253.1 hypothetical protein EN842_01285 [bacterium M00.F.Ca.ET.199.01.1.1]TGU41639.1 hypothetical protein EN799_03530 [bacterium M00.F.Ca.ET.156.01.1.1]TGV89737.1 hypothetical protein EN792_006155 [Mesorhizobium sp. M00.F.Ca.ET.149.01.1.1]TGR32995.1 hypothetical protein EN840_01285 [Mesorhizobium sp. M8A.F.Ca.ET.197.01.1.1]TGR34641.1 hypothetical protein EN845_01285 [Mesorhizobium sp. M8A.F.Ca.ET.202.01.1.1]
MEYTERDRADDIAANLALLELLRLAIGEICYSADPVEFRRRARAFEEAAVTSISGRTNFAKANEATETYVKEAACAQVTKIMASIRHPQDTGN